jgi:metal-responsive CopG/Arc/MetJ family transcriptional regulator
MARRQVIVQLDDALIERLDEIAAAGSISRSELLRRGANAILEAYRLAEQERAYVDGYLRTPQDEPWLAVLHQLAVDNVPPW